MQKITSSSRGRRWLAAVLFLTALLVTAAKRVFDYSAAPSKPKESDFIYPPNADQVKPTTLSLAAPTSPQLSFEQRGGFIDDASHLNKTALYGIVRVTSVEDIQNAVRFAREQKLKVTAAGSRHSMGGHTFLKDGLVLDMRGFNQLRLDKERKILTAQTGATWKQVQLLLDRYGLAVKAMQSINIFSIGGTLSVNAHGIAHDPGQVAPTVRAFRILLSNGGIKQCSRTENAELFHHALGGYGLMGVILDVDLDIVDNEMYLWKTHYMDYREFADYFEKNVQGNPDIRLTYGRLSMSPASFLRETAIHTYQKVDASVPLAPLKPPGYIWLDRLIMNFSKTGSAGRRLRWTMEKYAEPRIHRCVSRNQAMSREEGCFVSRNQEMYDSMDYLENRLPDTDILQEYFIPHHKMAEFVDGLRRTVESNGANLINVTIRIVRKDDDTTLNYAREDVFAYVLYFNQRFNEREAQILQKTTTDLIDLALSLDGTYYLPYQLFYSKEQLYRAYPRAGEFFSAKRAYDPQEVFTNKFYEKYGR